METETTKTLSSEQLENALFGQPKLGLAGVLDLMERCALPMDYVLLMDTARCAKQQISLEGDKIDVGIRNTKLTPEVISTLKEFTGVEDPTKTFTYMEGDVPVKVTIITRNYPWFKNPDFIIYKYENVQIPNPFDEYWHARGIVR